MLPKIIKPSVTRNQTMCSFTEEEFRDGYDVLVLNNDRILITGGYNISEGGSKPAVNILIYDIKTNKLSKASQDFKYTYLIF